MVFVHRDFVEREGTGQDLLHLVFVNFPGPGADQHRGYGVAGEIGQRPGLGHKPVDPHDQSHTLHQVRPVRLQTAGQGGQSSPGDPSGALGGDDHEHQQRNLLTDGQRHAQSFSNEQRGHGQVNGRAVQVEGIPRRHRDTDHRLRDTQVLHLGDQPRQRHLGG